MYSNYEKILCLLKQTSFPQIFALPKTIIYYLSKTPRFSCYQKLTKCCKYFYIANPVLIVTAFSVYQNKIQCHSWNEQTSTSQTFTVDKLSFKIWVTSRLILFPLNGQQENIALLIAPKIYRCNTVHLQLNFTIISFQQFLLLSQNVEYCCLGNVTLLHDDKSMVQLETIVENLPKLTSFDYTFGPHIYNFSVNTIKALLKLPRILKIKIMEFNGVPEGFDVENLAYYIKIAKNTEFFINFCEDISEDYKDRVSAVYKKLSTNYLMLGWFMQWHRSCI